MKKKYRCVKAILITTIFILAVLELYYSTCICNLLNLRFAVEPLDLHPLSEICQPLQTIHVAFVVNNSNHLTILLKSLLLYRNCPLHFHFLTNATDHLILETLLNTWQLHYVNYSFYALESFTRTGMIFSDKSYSAVSHRMKLIFPSILPSSVETIIILDSNVLFFFDIQELWTVFNTLKTENKMFSAFKNSAACGNLQDFEECFKTNIMLFDLQSMREKNIIFKLSNTELMYNHWSYELPPCELNVQVIGVRDTKCGQIYRIIQYQSINDLRSNIAQYPPLNKILNYDNYLLQYLLLDRDIVLENTAREHDLTICDVCSNLKEQSKINFITLLFFYGTPYSSVDEYDVTLVTQLSMNRVHTLHKLLCHWNGPASITVYGNESEKWNFMQFLKTYSELDGRSNVVMHIVYKRNGYYYPINYLRNTALSAVKTPYVFLTDLDFLPSYNLYSYLKNAAELLMTVIQQRALVVPAFEAVDKNTVFPLDKSLILKQINELFIQPFHPQFNGHYATNYMKWLTTSYPYVINWAMDYEPYVLVKSNVVKYDQRFIGYGRNKISHITQLKAQGYEFVVLPDVFLVHYPHLFSDDHLNYEKVYLKCISKLYTTYLNELYKKYGYNCLKPEHKGETKDILVKIAA